MPLQPALSPHRLPRGINHPLRPSIYAQNVPLQRIFHHLLFNATSPPPQALDFMVKKFMLADVVTVIGTLDVVFGEIDR